jgi:CheY-like chemotaxis protein/class 3 adenylate cyclase
VADALIPAQGSGLAEAPSPVELARALRHDLRTPINHIVGYSELLLEDLAESDLGPDLERVHAAGRELLALVDENLGPDQLASAETNLEANLVRLREAVRTPLTTVVGYADLLLEEASEQGAAELLGDLQRIRAAGQQLLARLEAAAIALPARAEPALAGPAPGETIPAPAAPIRLPVDQAAGRVLVVDDDPANRDLLSRRLQRLGHSVGLAEDGRAALAMLQQQPFDVVLLDLVMPGWDGFETLRRLRADPKLRNLPVIMLSAHDEVASAVRCIELGAEDYLPKPCDHVLLQARLGACLEQKRLRDREREHLHLIDTERQRADGLLRVILPEEVVDELKATDRVRPRRFDRVAVMFGDIVGFTSYCDQREPDEVIPHLQALVEACEEISQRHGLQKIKTIGDSFMAAAGLLRPTANPALSCVQAGAEMLAVTNRIAASWELRVGIHVGPVVAGVLGRRQYLFDLFGDTVNTAARIESHGEPGTITLSAAAWQHVAPHCLGAALGAVEVKGKGSLEMFRFEGFRTSPLLS